jgi:dihydroxyacetone kinase-like predicted kinase
MGLPVVLCIIMWQLHAAAVVDGGGRGFVAVLCKVMWQLHAVVVDGGGMGSVVLLSEHCSA